MIIKRYLEAGLSGGGVPFRARYELKYYVQFTLATGL